MWGRRADKPSVIYFHISINSKGLESWVNAPCEISADDSWLDDPGVISNSIDCPVGLGVFYHRSASCFSASFSGMQDIKGVGNIEWMDDGESILFILTDAGVCIAEFPVNEILLIMDGKGVRSENFRSDAVDGRIILPVRESKFSLGYLRKSHSSKSVTYSNRLISLGVAASKPQAVVAYPSVS